jgi:hypothetical protein
LSPGTARPGSIAEQQAGAALNCGLDASGNRRRRLRVDDRPHIRVGVHGISCCEALHQREGRFGKAIGDALDDQSPLDRGTALPGISGRTLHCQSGCAVDIGVTHDDQGIIPAELEHQPSVSYPFGYSLSGARRSGKRHQVDVRVIDHRVPYRGRIPGDHRQHFRRQPRLIKQLGKGKRGQRGRLRRL